VTQASDDGRHLAHHRIGDDACDVVKEAESSVGDPFRTLDSIVARDGANGDRAVHLDVVEILQVVDVDEHCRTREPEAHRRHQALAAGEHARVWSMFLQVCKGLVDGARPNVFEGCWDHLLPSSLRRKNHPTSQHSAPTMPECSAR
jgi:hypothetical protein